MVKVDIKNLEINKDYPGNRLTRWCKEVDGYLEFLEKRYYSRYDYLSAKYNKTITEVLYEDGYKKLSDISKELGVNITFWADRQTGELLDRRSYSAIVKKLARSTKESVDDYLNRNGYIHLGNDNRFRSKDVQN